METFAPAYFDYMSSSVYADVSGIVHRIEIGIETCVDRGRPSWRKYLDVIN